MFLQAQAVEPYRELSLEPSARKLADDVHISSVTKTEEPPSE
jgi:hypothetical protein